MIRVNFADLKSTQSNELASSSLLDSVKGFLGNKSIASDEQSRSLIKKLLVPICIGFVCSYTLDNYKQQKLEEIDIIIIKEQQIGEQLKKEINKIKDYEQMKNAVEKDEKTIRNKLDTIKKLTLNRAAPIEILIELSKLIPRQVWLNRLEMDPEYIALSGKSIDYVQISNFMKHLQKSAFFQEVKLGNTKTINEKNGQKLVQFSVNAIRRN